MTMQDHHFTLCTIHVFEDGFDHFSAHLIERAEKMQVKTGIKLSNYLNSHVELVNQESQVGNDDLMRNV